MTHPTPFRAARSFEAVLLVFLCAASISAHAQNEQPSLTFNAGAFSQYIFRGLTQTNSRPALQAGADYLLKNGLYAGTWASNISWISDSNPGTSSPVEWDLYAGYRRALGAGLGIDIGIQRYAYPARRGPLAEGSANPDMTELFVGVIWKALSLKYSQAVTNANGIQRSVGSNYLDLTMTVPMGNMLTLCLHGGRQSFHGRSSIADGLGITNGTLYAYNDVSAGLATALGKSSSFTILYTKTTASDAGYLVKGRNLGSQHVAVGLVQKF